MSPSSSSSVPESVLRNDQVQIAIADLRDRLADPNAVIDIASVEEVDWPDGSIGCPQPDMVYTQAIVNGMRIVLRSGNVDYLYHQGGRRDAFYCPPDSGKESATLPPADLDI